MDDVEAVGRNLRQRMETRLRSIRFQTAMADSDMSALMAEDWMVPVPIDNSTCYVAGHSNPVRLWSEIDNNKKYDDKTQLKYDGLLDLLMTTGAQPFINTADPIDGYRPIDAADANQRHSLRVNCKRYGVDMNPTATNSPLFNCAIGYGYGVHSIRMVVDAMDPAYMDWTDPETGATALHAICRFATEMPNKNVLPAVDCLLSFVGKINPNHPCLVTAPIDDPRIVPRLTYARELAAEYATVHLPKQIFRGILKSDASAPVWLPIIRFVVQYAF